MATDWQALWDDFLEAAIDDTEAEIRCYEMVAKFEEIDKEIGLFLDTLAKVFGGFTWIDAFGDVHYSPTYNQLILDHCIYCPHGPEQGYADACEDGCMVPNM